MRIAILTPTRYGHGGVEVFSNLLAEILGNAGHQVDFLTLSESKPPRWIDWLPRKLIGPPWSLSRTFRNDLSGYQLVIANGEYAWGIHHPSTIQIFHGCYRGFLQHLGPSIKWIQRINLDRLARIQKSASRGKTVVAVSRFVADILAADGIVVNKVIPNAVDTHRFTPKESIRFPDRLLFIGTYNRFGKGFDILEGLAARGIKIDCITDQNPGCGLGWKPQVPHNQLPEIIPDYGGFIFPSRFEGMALSPLEALACGVPILTSNVGFGLELSAMAPEMVFDWRLGPTLDLLESKARQLLTDRQARSIKSRQIAVEHYSMQTFEREWLQMVDVTASYPRSP